MSASSHRSRILVVDDDAGVLRAVERVLRERYELASTVSPSEAIERAKEFVPDLAILDIRMPALNGFELMLRLKAELEDIDVILMTGSITEPDSHLIRAIQQGAFYFIQKPFDRQVLQTLVDRCLELRRLRAVANCELTKLHLAQSRLLPQAPPRYSGYKIAFRYRPFYFATGDYHDFFLRRDGSLGVFVGDSSGHGPSACIVMATMRALLYAQRDTGDDPGNVLSGLGQMGHRLIPPDLFMTAVYALLERNGRVRWAAGGQHPPLRISVTGKIAPAESKAVGLPLLVDPQHNYETVTWQLGIGERLLIFTDGIVEATNPKGQMFGLSGLHATLKDAVAARLDCDSLVQTVVDRVKEYMDTSDFGDDFTLLAIERTDEK